MLNGPSKYNAGTAQRLFDTYTDIHDM